MQCDFSVRDSCRENGVLCGEENVFALHSDDRVGSSESRGTRGLLYREAPKGLEESIRLVSALKDTLSL